MTQNEPGHAITTADEAAGVPRIDEWQGRGGRRAGLAAATGSARRPTGLSTAMLVNTVDCDYLCDNDSLVVAFGGEGSCNALHFNGRSDGRTDG